MPAPTMAVTPGKRQHNSVIAIRRIHAADNEEVGKPSGTFGGWLRERLTTPFDRLMASPIPSVTRSAEIFDRVQADLNTLRRQLGMLR